MVAGTRQQAVRTSRQLVAGTRQLVASIRQQAVSTSRQLQTLGSMKMEERQACCTPWKKGKHAAHRVQFARDTVTC